MDTPAKPKRTRVNKQKRVSRACNCCRARRLKCDGSHPTCSRCSARGYPCSYGPDLKKHGLTTGYVRALELLWGLMFSVVPNSKAIVQELLPDIQFALDSRSRLVLNSRLVRDFETLRQAWDGSNIQQELDHLLSNIQQEDGSAANSMASLQDGASAPGLAKAVKIVPTSSPANDARLVSVCIDTGKSNPPSPQRESDLQQNLWNDVSLPATTKQVRRLIDAYFAYTNCWLPIVQKHKMLELLYSSSQNSRAEEGNLATFWAILAYASLQDTRNTTGPSDSRFALSTAESIYSKARQRITNEDARLPGYVPALLILSLFKIDQEDLVSSWHLIGQAVRICLNLNAAPSTGKGSNAANIDDESQKRLLLSCLILDTLVSCRLRKPPHLRTGDLCFSPMLAEEGRNEWEPQDVIFTTSDDINSIHQPSRVSSIFNRYVSLICILNDAMSVKRPSDGHSAGFLLALNRWHDGLPAHCLISPLPARGQPGASPHLTPQLYNLHLAFASTDLYLRSQEALVATNRLSGAHIPTLAGLSMGYLMAAFVKDFGVANMPAIFKIYQDIGLRRVLRPVPQNRSVDSLVPVSPHPNMLPTPPEFSANIGKPERGYASSSNGEVKDEYDVETWNMILGTSELSEASIPTIQQDMESPGYLDGMTW